MRLGGCLVISFFLFSINMVFGIVQWVFLLCFLWFCLIFFQAWLRFGRMPGFCGAK